VTAAGKAQQAGMLEAKSAGHGSHARGTAFSQVTGKELPQVVKDNSNASGQEEHDSNSPSEMDGARIISYNFSEGERPAGLKVRAKIRVVGGKAAGTLDATQAEAIKELLLWSRQQRTRRQQP
jgi:hypothetical protein